MSRNNASRKDYKLWLYRLTEARLGYFGSKQRNTKLAQKRIEMQKIREIKEYERYLND